MSSEKDGDPSSAETGFVCGIEASALLNCVASKQYSEAKCKPLLQKLRACIEKKVRTHNLTIRHSTRRVSTCKASCRKWSSLVCSLRKVLLARRLRKAKKGLTSSICSLTSTANH